MISWVPGLVTKMNKYDPTPQRAYSISEDVDISPGTWIQTCNSSSLAFCMMYLVFFIFWALLGLTVRHNYSLMAAEMQVFFFFLSVLTTHQLTLEVCNDWRLWHTCSLIWQEIFHFSPSTRFIWLFSFFFHIHCSLTMLIQVLIMPVAVNKLNFEQAIYEEMKPSTKA